MNYSELSTTDFIIRLLHNKSLCPCLLIGKYVNEFKRTYKGTIERCYSLNDVKRIVDEYDGITEVNSDFLVLEGVGYLSETGQNSLLKFIEESKLPIIVLSYSDKVSPIIHSRMKNVMKKWYDVKTLDFLPEDSALKNLNEKKKEPDFREENEIQYLAEACPMLYQLKVQAGDRFDYNNSRMIELMCLAERKRGM